MNYNYKCLKCEHIQEVTVSTYDIIDKVGRVNQEELTKRIKEDRFCECGGKLNKILSNPQEAMWFNSGIGKGKISQRFK